MKKLMVLMLSLLLCACSTSENKEKETPKEDPKNENTTVSFVSIRNPLLAEMRLVSVDIRHSTRLRISLKMLRIPALIS